LHESTGLGGLPGPTGRSILRRTRRRFRP
jgi:hypothetical protein